MGNFRTFLEDERVKQLREKVELLKKQPSKSTKVVHVQHSDIDWCAACPLRGQRKVEPEGDMSSAELILVGEAPGRQEEEEGRPFVGKSGQLLRMVLEQVIGVDMSKVYITNVVKCRPAGNATPDKDMVKCCGKWLEQELKNARNAKLVVALGSVASKKLVGKEEVLKYRGMLWNTKYGKVMTTLHPAFRGMRVKDVLNREMLEYWVRDLKHAWDYVCGNGDKLMQKVNDSYKVVKTPEDLASFVAAFGDGELVAVDFETTGLDPFDLNADVLSVAFSSETQWWVVPFVWLDGEVKNLATIATRKIIEKTRPVMFNAGFDMLWGVLKLGWSLKEVDDIQLMWYLWTGNSWDSLKRLAIDLLGVRDWHIDFSQMAQMDDEHLWQYNVMDTVVTLKLYKLMKELLYSELPTDEFLFGKASVSVWDVYEKLLKPAQRALLKVKLDGAVVDTQYLRKLHEKLTEELQNVKDRLNQLCPGVNVNSPKQVLEVLKARGIAVDKTGKKELEALVGKDEFVDLLMKHRELEKLRGTYVEPLMAEHIKADGKVHPTFLLNSTATGRTSCTDPNLQNVPVKFGSLIENAFISRFGEKGRIIKADFSQHELRVAALYSKDEMMLQYFKQGIDLHTKVAMEIYGLKEDQLEDKELVKQKRRVAKGFNFGVIYGRGPKSIANEVGLSEDEAQLVVQKYFNLFSGLKRWLDGVKVFVETHRLVRTMFGRVRRFNAELYLEDDSKMYREGVNTPIQSAASDIALYCLVRVQKELEERGMKSVIWNFVHDAILVDSPEEEVQEVIDMINKYRGQLLREFGYPEWMSELLAVDVAVGTSWGACKEQK